MIAGTAENQSEQKTGLRPFSHRVLLRPPTSMQVPIFGIVAAQLLPPSELWSVSGKDEKNIIDKQTYGRLRVGDFGLFQIQVTRHTHSIRLAYYADWIAFDDEKASVDFEDSHSDYGLSNIIADNNRRMEIIEHDLKQGLGKGRYDLSKIEENRRYKRAKLFVDNIDALKMLAFDLEKLEFLKRELEDHPICQ